MEARVPYISESFTVLLEQVVNEDVVLVHDDCLRINWKMAVVEGLVKGGNELVRSVNKRTKNGVTIDQ